MGGVRLSERQEERESGPATRRAAYGDVSAHGRCQATYEALSAEGYRVLAVACRDVPRQAAYTASNEQHLVLVAVSLVLRLHQEESGQRAETLLSGSVSRSRWVAGHLMLALLGSLMTVFLTYYANSMAVFIR